MGKRGKSTEKVVLISVIILVLIAAIVLIVFFLNAKKVSAPDPVSTQCQFACDSGQQGAFCTLNRILGDSFLTCEALASNSEYAKYNVAPCPTISCIQQGQQQQDSTDYTCVTGLGGTWETPISGGCSQGGTKIRREVTSSDSAPVAGQICCR